MTKTNLKFSLRQFYSSKGPNDFAVDPNHFTNGLRLAVKYEQQWDRAEVIGKVDPQTGKVKVFFIDYGTTGLVRMTDCKMLMETFAKIPRKAIRAALHGIKPPHNNRLWSLKTTNWFVNKIWNKEHRIKIVNFNEMVS